MGKPAKNFASKEAYQKWLAYGHMHGQFKASPGNTPVKIEGHPHHVDHNRVHRDIPHRVKR